MYMYVCKCIWFVHCLLPLYMYVLYNSSCTSLSHYFTPPPLSCSSVSLLPTPPPYLSSRHPSSWNVWSSSPWIRSATSAHVTPRSVSGTTSVYACTCNLHVHVQYLGGKVSEIPWLVTAENPLLFRVEFVNLCAYEHR